MRLVRGLLDGRAGELDVRVRRGVCQNRRVDGLQRLLDRASFGEREMRVSIRQQRPELRTVCAVYSREVQNHCR